MFTPPMSAALLLWVTLIPILLLTTLSISSHTTFLISWTMMSTPPTHFSLPLFLDPTALLFSSVILFIAANVLQFSAAYMKLDPFLPRFTALVMLFVFSMLLLVFIPHLMFLLLGWDGLGITSFLLVAYYQNPKSLAAGMITALMNRIGDALLLLSISLMLNHGHWLITMPPTHTMHFTITLMIVAAAMTKSAQIPFSSWLPAAMAAPTPVSALVHSSTLVTAGVFLLIRFYPSILATPQLKAALLMLATTTMLMASTAAMVESDLKKIIALSTLSQLGLMIATISLDMPSLATFHLLTHALFKALLFICAGTMIHHYNHTQDLRQMSNTPLQLPITTTSMGVANLALCGTPFLAGFYSKDTIIEMLLLNPSNLLITLIFLLSTTLTAAYATRFMMILLWLHPLSPPLHAPHDEDSNLTTPMIFLTLAAVTIGALLGWTHLAPQVHPTLPTLMKLLPLMSVILGGASVWLLLFSHSPSHPNQPPLHHLTSMWFLTPLTSQNLLNLPLHSALITTTSIDHAWLPSISAMGPPNTFLFISTHLQPPQSATINTHLLMSILCLIPLMYF